MHPTAFAESIAGGGGTPWLLQQQPTNRQPNNGNSSKTYLKPLLKKIPTLPNPLDIGTRCVNLRKNSSVYSWRPDLSGQLQPNDYEGVEWNAEIPQHLPRP